MQRSDLPKFKRLLTSTHTKLKSITDDELYGWFLVLQPYSYEECKNALLAYTRVSTFAPVPSEIAQHIEAKRPKAYTEAKSAEEHYRYLANVYARIAEIEPPAPDVDPLLWFRTIKGAV